MANVSVKIKVGGHWRWISASLIDAGNAIVPLTINGTGETSTDAEVTDAGIARLVIHAMGDRGKALTADVVKNGKSLSRKRTYTFSADGFVDRSVSFDPKS